MTQLIHSFSVDEAEKYGVEKAVILYNFRFWLTKNQANDKHNIEGYYWTYNSAKALAALFPYLNAKKISRLLKELEQAGALVSGNHNKAGYDRTKWYSMPEFAVKATPAVISQKCEMDSPDLSNAFPKNAPPIPDVNTDSKPDINTPLTPQGGKVIKIRVSKPDSFKQFFASYPAHRKGGNDSQAWKTWKAAKLTDHDADLANHWLTQAAIADPQNWSTSANGFALGITRFINDTIWLTPLPRPSGMSNDSIEWAGSLEEIL